MVHPILVDGAYRALRGSFFIIFFQGDGVIVDATSPSLALPSALPAS